jgi:signal transduction histidine kinase
MEGLSGTNAVTRRRALLACCVRVGAAADIGAVLGGRGGAIVLASIAIAIEWWVVELVRRHRESVQIAIAQERRRVARDLHDGVAQDLAFIATCGRHLAGRAGNDGLLTALSLASSSALEATRCAIGNLDAAADEMLVEALARSTGELADRHGVKITVSGDASALESAPRRDVVQLVREAVNNAACHGRARAISIELGGDALLRVRDDGTGIDAARPAREGSRGMRGMEERADRLGGRLVTACLANGGTEVAVV